MQFQRVEFRSPAYYQSLALRYDVLRNPLGLHFSKSDLVPDQTSLHFVGIKDNQVVACLILSGESNKINIGNRSSGSYSDDLYKFRTEGILLQSELRNNSDSVVFKMRQVAVNSSLQGKGIGKQLIQFVEIEAQKIGITHFELNARKSAVPFYLSMNYKIASDEFQEVGIPHFKMKKAL